MERNDRRRSSLPSSSPPSPFFYPLVHSFLLTENLDCPWRRRAKGGCSSCSATIPSRDARGMCPVHPPPAGSHPSSSHEGPFPHHPPLLLLFLIFFLFLPSLLSPLLSSPFQLHLLTFSFFSHSFPPIFYSSSPPYLHLSFTFLSLPPCFFFLVLFLPIFHLLLPLIISFFCCFLNFFSLLHLSFTSFLFLLFLALFTSFFSSYNSVLFPLCLIHFSHFLLLFFPPPPKKSS